MSLFTISYQFLSRGLLVPRKRILLNYAIAMVTIFGISGISLYVFVIKSLNQQLNQELLILVEAATPSLSTVKKEGKQNLDQEVSWRNLFSGQKYSLEWYDSQGELLAQEGNHLTNSPLFKTIPAAKLNQKAPVFQRQGKIRTATISVYKSDIEGHRLVLEGYIRASQSTQKIEAVVNRLTLGLEFGAATAIILTCFSSIYLTTETLKPMKQGVQRLRRITADVSHQVRTPLTRISIATEMLLIQTGNSEISQVKKLNIINAAAEQLKHLLEELLFLIRMDTTPNLKEPKFAYLSPLLILQSLKEQFEPIAKAKGISLETQLSGNILIKGDAEQLKRLLTNLLNNAIQYTDAEGSILFSVEQSQNQVVVTVKDTGIGISEEHLPFIFQDFWRSELAKTKYPNGFGLGLAIAEAIAQRHQGEITVKSEIGAGSCFQVYFPTA